MEKPGNDCACKVMASEDHVRDPSLRGRAAWALESKCNAALSFSLLSTGQAASSLVLCLPGLAGPTVTCLFELTMSEIKGS